MLKYINDLACMCFKPNTNTQQCDAAVTLLIWNTLPFFAYVLSTYIDKDFPNSYIQDSKQSYILLENKKLILSNPKIYFYVHCDKM